MKKFDDLALNEIRKYTQGAEPEAYIYALKNAPFLLFLMFGMLAQTPYLMAVRGEQFLFIRSNYGCNKYKEEYFILHKSDIQDVKYRKFGFAHYMTIIKTDGTKLRLVASPMFKRFEKQAENLETIKRKLGVTV